MLTRNERETVKHARLFEIKSNTHLNGNGDCTFREQRDDFDKAKSAYAEVVLSGISAFQKRFVKGSLLWTTFILLLHRTL